MKRRALMAGGAAAAASAAGWLGTTSQGHAAAEDYRVLVVVFLGGGNDGHNMLVPTDAMYGDYQSARANLALPRASLAALPGMAVGHSFGLHPALAPLVPLYAQQRLGFIANVGPLVEPATASQVRENAVHVPPFLFSHNDQVAIQQGWPVSDDPSGWGGRTLEALPSSLRNPFAAVVAAGDVRLTQGRQSPVSHLSSNPLWGAVDLERQPQLVQSLQRIGQQQHRNRYLAAYAEYVAGRFGEAQAEFALLVVEFADGPAKTLAARCAELQQQPPAAWDGIWRMAAK